MNIVKRFSAVFAIALGIGGAGGVNAGSALLPAPGTVFNCAAPGCMSEEGGIGGGVVVAGATTVGFIGTDAFSVPVFSGDLVSWVIKSDALNPHGGLTFVYQMSNNFGSAHPIARLSVNNFSGFTTSVAFIDAVDALPGGAVGVPNLQPTTATRGSTGTTIGWNFSVPGGGELQPSPGLPPATNWTSLLIVYTDAPSYVWSSAAVQNGGNATTNAWGPSAIPEPETYAMMLAGLGLMGFIARRRRQNGAA